MMRFPLPSLARPFRPSLFVPMLLAAALTSCGQSEPPPPPPIPEAAMAAVAVDPGIPRETLARAIDTIFTVEGIGETYGLLVMHEGEVVAERYAEGFNAETRFSGWSLSKSVTGVLIGMMVADGRVRLDDPAPIDHWQRAGDPRGEITLRHLLQMRSGLRHSENAEPRYESDEVRMLFLDGRDDMARWAEAQPLEHEAGSHFQYSSATSVILSDIAARLLAPGGNAQQRQQAMALFLEARLGAAMSAPSFTAEYDAQGTMVGSSHIWATARDWAKFGELLRHGGSVGGVPIVPRSWIDFMISPGPQSPDYGGHIWLNQPSGTDRNVMLPRSGPGSGPDSIYAAIGHLGQYVLVSPDQRLTVVRLGHSEGEERDALIGSLGAVMALYPVR